MEKQKEKPKYNLFQNTGYMIGKAWKHTPSVLWLILAIIVVTVLQSLAGLYIAPSVLEKVEAHAPLAVLLRTIGLFAGALLLLSAADGFLSMRTTWKRSQLRVLIFGLEIHSKFWKTSYPHIEDPDFLKKADAAMNAMGGNNSCLESIWDILTKLSSDIVRFMIYLLLMTAMHPLLIVLVLAASTASYFLTKRANNWAYEHREERAGYVQKLDYVYIHARDRALAKDVRIFGMKSWLEDLFADAMRLYDDFVQRREKKLFAADAAAALFTLLRNGGAYVFLILKVLDGSITAPQFLLYFTAVTGFTEWITGIFSGFARLHQQSIEISIVREYLDVPEPFAFEEGERLTPEPDRQYSLELRHVSFRYPGAEKDTIHDMNLTIHPGEKLAIVGLNGAGKTTLVKLLCGFYDPTEGEVLLGGEDIRKYNRRDYYALFTAVFQQLSILDATVEENVAQDVENIDEAKVCACLSFAGLAEDVETLPKGLKTNLGRRIYEDGVELSGGQQQRLMLARALYKNAPILVLDEPTAALDPIAESDMYSKYNEMTRGRTSVFISHRLASTRFCDRIILLSDGVIAEEGTHESLMEKNGTYTALFNVQSKYYAEGGEENGKEDLL